MDWATALVLVLAAAAVAAVWLSRRRRTPAPASSGASEPPAEPPPSLAEQLQRLGGQLESESEHTTHPREMVNFEAFKAAVALLADPACELETVRLYAFGRIWTLSCAAFEALRTREDKQELLASAMAQLKTHSPGALHYVLRYLAALDDRPAAGKPALIAQAWWANHSMLLESFRDYFEARSEAGDAATFGDADLTASDLDLSAVQAFLDGVDHDFSGALIDELRSTKARTVDERALSVYGRFWRRAEADLVIEPAAWSEALEAATKAVLASPPRSVLVTGGPRIGKSSFLRLVGERMADAGWHVYEAAASDLMSDQMYIGQIEGRVRSTVAALEVGKRVAWCIGDIAMLAGSGRHQGQAASLLDQIWPAVAAGRLVLLAEASAEGASRVLQSRPSLRMNLELVRLGPFTDGQLTALAEAVAARLERRRGASISAAAREAALHYAQQYLGAAEAPGVVADVLKRAVEGAMAGVGAMAARAVGPEAIVSAVAQMSGLPAEILADDAPISLADVRAYFAERVIGQDEAIGAIVDRIAMLKAGLVDTTKPIGVFLFAGPTGTGKTELAKTLAEFLFGAPERLVRLDMSEFQNADAVTKIVGERGQGGGSDPLTEQIRKQPFSVVLLDEFEKEHANIWDLFLQVFDDGRLTDANGHTVDLRHTIIILTSNLGGASHRSSGMGFARKADVFTEQQVMLAVERAFRPEFVNRLDRIVVFKPLSRELMYRILRKELAGVLGRRGLKSRDWAVEWEPSALDFLLDKGFSAEMGARPLKRAIDHYLLAPLAATLVEHRFPQGDQFLFVRAGQTALEVEFLDPDATAPAVAAPAQPETSAEVSLAGLVLRPEGDGRTGAWLVGRAESLCERLEAGDWAKLKAGLAAEAADPEIWLRPERFRVFAGLNLIDRVGEAARTAERLAARLRSGARSDVASRELVGRLALQLFLAEAGVIDALTGAPVDAVVAVTPALEGGSGDAAGSDWPRRVLDMYRGWAERRRMQSGLIAPPAGDAAPLLYVSGFGAWRTLAGEAGLHVLEHPAGGPLRRETVRVQVIEGPDEEIAPARQYAELSARFASAGRAGVVRRYRERPSPLVRDAASGGRSGHLDLVLAGDFDLIFARSE